MILFFMTMTHFVRSFITHFFILNILPLLENKFELAAFEEKKKYYLLPINYYFLWYYFYIIIICSHLQFLTKSFTFFIGNEESPKVDKLCLYNNDNVLVAQMIKI